MADLERALNRGEFEVHLQPIVRLTDGKIKGFEVLIRWRRPGLGKVMPAEFIPLLKTTELIVPFGTRVVRDACRILREWKLQHPAAERLLLSIKLSAGQLEDPLLFQTVSGLVEDAGLQPSSLRLGAGDGMARVASKRGVGGSTLQRVNRADGRLNLDG